MLAVNSGKIGKTNFPFIGESHALLLSLAVWRRVREGQVSHPFPVQANSGLVDHVTDLPPFAYNRNLVSRVNPTHKRQIAIQLLFEVSLMIAT